MRHEFWLERWQEGQLGWHRDEVHPDLMASAEWLTEGGRTVLVPLCGKTLDLDWLSDRVPVIGAELSPIAVQEVFARREVVPDVTPSGAHQRYQADQLTIFLGDILALTPDQVKGVAGVWDRGALVALPPETRKAYAAHLQGLIPSCRMLLNCLRYNPCGKQGPPHSIAPEEIAMLYPNARVERVAVRDESTTIRDTWREAGMTSMQVEVYRISWGDER